MTLSHVREHNGITFYGYTYPQTGDMPYWSMRFYPEAWDQPYANLQYLPIWTGPL